MMARPKSEQALTHAERQAAYRKRHVTETPSVTETSDGNPAVVTETLGAAAVIKVECPEPYCALPDGHEGLHATAQSLMDTSNPRRSPLTAPREVVRQTLRDRLAALEAQYRAAQRAQDWPTCRRVNEEREPLFGQLWELERELPESERYWFPARIINQGEGFAVGSKR